MWSRFALSPDPTILAFDTSAAHCAAALLRADRIAASRHRQMRRGQAEHLMPMVEAVMAEAGVAYADIDAIGVGIGPGNFTGLRVAISAARGLSMARGIPAIGVSTFELVRGVGDDDPTPQIVCIPSGRRDGDVLLQPFVGGTPEGGPLEMSIADGAPAALGDLSGWEIRGTGARTVAITLGSTVPHREVAIQDWAASIARRVAAKREAGRDHPRPAPIYARPPDAVPPPPAPLVSP